MSSGKMDLSFLLGRAAPAPPRSLYEQAGWAEATAPPYAPPDLPPMSPPAPDSPYAPPPQLRPSTPPSSAHSHMNENSRGGENTANIGMDGPGHSREMNVDGVVVNVAGKDMQSLYARGNMLVTPQARHTCACGARYNRGLHYLHHLSQRGAACDPLEGAVYLCDHDGCNSAFRRKTDRAKHISCVHSKLRPYKCMECGCGFFFQKDVRKHFETVHRKLRPFQCTRCSNCFGKKEHLKNHVNRTHLHIKPYGCNICDVSLASKHNLQSHLQSRGHKATAAALLSRRAGVASLETDLGSGRFETEPPSPFSEISPVSAPPSSRETSGSGIPHAPRGWTSSDDTLREAR